MKSTAKFTTRATMPMFVSATVGGRKGKSWPMVVVPAGVHRARVAGRELEVVLLLDGERVHVGPDGEGASRTLTHEPGYHAGLRGAGELQISKRLQRLVDEPGGLFFMIRDLGVAVQVSPPFDDFFSDVLYEVVENCGCDSSIPPLWTNPHLPVPAPSNIERCYRRCNLPSCSTRRGCG
jgi:hypothetical protein